MNSGPWEYMNGELLFSHSVIMLRLCKEYLTVLRLETLLLLLIKYWMFCYCDYTASMKSRTLENGQVAVTHEWRVRYFECSIVLLDRCKEYLTVINSKHQVIYWTFRLRDEQIHHQIQNYRLLTKSSAPAEIASLCHFYVAQGHSR